MITALTIALFATSGSLLDIEPARREAQNARSEYWDCLKRHVGGNDRPAIQPNRQSLSSEERALADTALKNCSALEARAIAGMIYLKSFRSTNETAFDLRARATAELRDLAESRFRGWFGIGWVSDVARPVLGN